ncbi:sigma-70 family RNA polymerase sigma factor [Lacibacterium aquatile]|uniref:Sigma-70 family RNA polymerase sigma factor n=1 Tax=Lacibacterium aquatile TaxID=1168082 RepID=A0ABW5DYJ8_9PROT
MNVTRPRDPTGQEILPLGHRLVSQLPHLQAFARVLCQDATLAKDLVQDTTLRALEHTEELGGIPTPDGLKAWLFRTLRNVYYDRLRFERRRRHATLDEVETVAAVDGGQEGRNDMRDLEAALNKLAPVLREAVALIGTQGLTHEQAAGVAGCSAATMRMRLSRARRQLKTILTGDGDSGEIDENEKNA